MIEPKKFRKKPVVIEAMQYTLDDRDAVAEWCGAITTGIDESGAEYERMNLLIHTLEGMLYVGLGNWIIKGVEGEFYPCKDGIFQKTYEEV